MTIPFIRSCVPTLYPLLRAALFRLSAETAHELTLGGLAGLPQPAIRVTIGAPAALDPRLSMRLWDIDFPNPVGLAAGFDKSGRAFNALGALGFGHVEIGTVTAQGQPGNPKPRLFRLPKDKALLNRMGFNNPGAENVARRLANSPVTTVLGVNIGKSKVTPLDQAVDDYLASLELLAPFARYVVVNVSSPNTPGLRELQEAGPLRALLRAVVKRSAELGTRNIPILVKLAPDLADTQLDQAVEIALEEGASGLVAANTTLSREGLQTPRTTLEKYGAGGISGAPIRARALAMVRRIHHRVQRRVPIIGVGGIFSASDAWERIRAGASLVQLYTGFIYEGPAVVRRINEGLLKEMEAGGFSSLIDAVGSGEP